MGRMLGFHRSSERAGMPERERNRQHSPYLHFLAEILDFCQNPHSSHVQQTWIVMRPSEP